jgi:hypothetical protein
VPGGGPVEQDDGMSRVLTWVAGVVAVVGFAGIMTRVAEHPLVFAAFLVAIMFLVLRRAVPELVLGPADPPLPPPAPALAEAKTPGSVGALRLGLKVSVHPDRIVVGSPLYGRRTIMADQVTGLAHGPGGSLRIDHVAGTLRSAPVLVQLPAGAPLRQALEWFAAHRPVLPAPTPAPGWWTFLRVWALVAGTAGVAVGVYETVRGNPMGVQLIVGSVVAVAVVWFLATGRVPFFRR